MTETKTSPFPNFWLFPAAILAGATFWAASHMGLSGALFVAWKGVGVGLLTLCAALAARDRNGWLLTALLALGTLGDVVLETSGIVIGGVAFLAGHLVSILLYLSNRRKEGGAAAIAIALAVPAIAFAITRDIGATFYAAGLGGMARCCLVQSFSADHRCSRRVDVRCVRPADLRQARAAEGLDPADPDDLAALSRRPDADRIRRAENPRGEEAE